MTTSLPEIEMAMAMLPNPLFQSFTMSMNLFRRYAAEEGSYRNHFPRAGEDAALGYRLTSLPRLKMKQPNASEEQLAAPYHNRCRSSSIHLPDSNFVPQS